MKKKSVLLTMILILVFAITACGGENMEELEDLVENGEEIVESEVEKLSIEDIKSKGKLIMGTNADYPPFEFHALIDGKDVISGLDIEIAKYIADDLGVELEIRDMDFNNLLGGISTGMLDIVIAGMNPEPEREKQVSFSDIYYEVNLSLLVRKDLEKAFETEDDLIGTSIGVQIGTTQEDIANEIKDAKVVSLKTNSDAVMNLKTNKIESALLETIVAESFANTNDDIKMVENLIIKTESGGSAIATQKGNEELVQYLNEKIAEMKEKGLIEKWMKEAEKLSNSEI